MTIVTILGSPKSNGNTGKLLSMFEDKIKNENDIERINISKYKVNGCIGCYKCKETTDAPGCVQKDDVATIFKKILAADGVVYASPLYCWGFTSQVKALIDRHFCLVSGEGGPSHHSLMKAKPVALLVTCAGPIEENCDAIQSSFNNLASYLMAKSIGNYILPFCTTPKAINAEGNELAEKLSKSIV